MPPYALKEFDDLEILALTDKPHAFAAMDANLFQIYKKIGDHGLNVFTGASPAQQLSQLLGRPERISLVLEDGTDLQTIKDHHDALVSKQRDESSRVGLDAEATRVVSNIAEAAENVVYQRMLYAYLYADPAQQDTLPKGMRRDFEDIISSGSDLEASLRQGGMIKEHLSMLNDGMQALAPIIEKARADGQGDIAERLDRFAVNIYDVATGTQPRIIDKKWAVQPAPAVPVAQPGPKGGTGRW